MAQIPGARAKLDRLGRVMRAELLDLVGRLTPEADDVAELGAPTVSAPRGSILPDLPGVR